MMFMVITTSQEHRIVPWPTMRLDPFESSACDTAIICIFGEATKIGDLLLPLIQDNVGTY